MAAIDQVITDRYSLVNGDCVESMRAMPDDSIHLSIYSPPFATERGGLYHYTSDERDLSNCTSYEEFFQHYEYVVKEVARLTLPGRSTAVHCADVPTGNTGNDHLRDFTGDIIRLHEKLGFYYAARYSIWKDPFEVYIRTLAKGLRHRSMVDDSSRCTCAAADYLLVFRKKGENKIPVVHPTGLMDYIGARSVPAELLKYRGHTGKQTENKYSQWIWRQYASAFWDDIRGDNVLPYQDCREPDDERHVHPLQLDVIERACVLWSNPGENVMSPFSGVGSEPYGAVVQGRNGIGFELKTAYYRQSVKNLTMAVDPARSRIQAPKQRSLFADAPEVMDGEDAVADAAP